MREFKTTAQNIRSRLSEIRPLLICFSHLRWDFVFQRPQHLLTRAAKTYRVIVMEEPTFGDISEPTLSLSRRPGGITIAVPLIPHGTSDSKTIEIQRQLLNDLLKTENRRPRVAWFYSPAAVAFAGHIQADTVIYDCMDELANFKNAPASLKEQERRLFARADIVFTGGHSLYAAKKSLHSNIHAFPSSIDKKHFGKARAHDLPEPDDLKNIPHPRIGFFGVIDERMDTDLVAQVAALKPEWHFVMIGPVVKIDEADLPRAKNLHWIGGKNYKELPQYLAHWDLGFMPFAINDATKFISPTKTPEFLAAGLPVVSTPITDVVSPYGQLGLVEIASTAAQTVSAIDKLFAMRRETWLKTVDEYLATISWDDTWKQMNRLIGARVAERRAAAWRGTIVSGIERKEAASV